MANEGTNNETLLLRIIHDRASIAAAKSALKDFTGTTERDVNKLNQKLSESSTVSAKLNNELSKLARQRQIADLTKDIDKVKRGSDEWYAKLRQIENQLLRIGATRAEIAGVAGSIASAQSAESSGQISPGLSRFGAKARFLLPAINVGGVSSEGLSKIVQVLGALPAVTAPVILGVGGMVVAFGALESSIAPAKKALEGAIQANKEYYDLIASRASTQDVKDRVQDLNDSIASQQQELDTILGGFDSASQAALDDYGILIGGFFNLLSRVSTGDDSAVARVDELRKSLEQETATRDRLQSEIDRNSFAQNDARIAEEKRRKAIEETTPKLIALAEQANNLINNFTNQNTTIFEDRRIRDQRAEEDWQIARSAQLEAHLDNLARIDAAGLERLVNIRQQGNDKIAKADADIAKINANIADVASDLRDDLAEVDADYMAETTDAYEDFRQQILKEDKSFAKERARLLEDINNDLLDLEADNDVAGFVRRQRQGAIELRRQAEDHDEEIQQEQEAFEQERQIAARRREERIADLIAAANERRADLQQQIEERQAAKAQLILDIEEQLKAERARIDATNKAAQDAFVEQQKRDEEARQLRIRRQQEDDALADQRRLDQLNKQLADIAKKAQAEAAAIGIVGNSLTLLISAVQSGTTSAINNILARANSINSYGSFGSGTTNGTNSSYYNPSNGFGTGFKPFGFAEGSRGRIVDRPTPAILGEKPGWGDLVTPFPLSGGVPMPQGMGGKTVIVNLNGNISGVDKNFVRGELHKMGQMLIEFEAEARSA